MKKYINVYRTLSKGRQEIGIEITVIAEHKKFGRNYYIVRPVAGYGEMTVEIDTVYEK